jgi:murein DD-endopeptidase MepM/ murein hydrolase activator NlpD
MLSLVWAWVSLACAVGMLDQRDPLFAAPAGGAQWTPTAEPALPTGDASFPDVSPSVVETYLEATPTPALSSASLEQAPAPVETTPLLYYTQAGDTLSIVAEHFNVMPEDITSPVILSENSLIPPNTLLIIPRRLANTTSSIRLLPDSEVVYSPTAIDFDVEAYIQGAGGYLSQYREWLGSTQWTSGAEIIERVAIENSINPRLLLALLEYQSGWVYGWPDNALEEDYPLGKVDLSKVGLYSQLIWAVNHLSNGYYGWREGSLTEIQFSDGVTARLAPDLNAGTVALQYYFTQVYDTLGWVQALDPTNGFSPQYERLFGSPWVRAMDFEPLFPADLTQPPMILPFLIGQVWSFTGGPHGAWEHDGARAALDFAPATTDPGCSPSNAWVVAAAAGLVVRTGHGVVVIDLDGDGFEQTGWNILYLHVSDLQVSAGDWVEVSDLLGHPSCEGGFATGTHVHIARKYNGEWVSADGPLAFTLSGWQAHAGSDVYLGTLTRDDQTIPASVFGAHESRIVRTRDDP